MESVLLPSTLKRIEYSAFEDCKGLKNIALPDSLEYIGKQCFWESGLTEVQIPRSGVQVGERAFYNCPAKSSIIFF